MISLALTNGLVLLAAATGVLQLPLDDPDRWTELAYRNIRANVVVATNDGLRIEVDGSSSPLVFKLPSPTAVAGFTVRARWSGALAIPEGKTQGEPGADDFVLKFGLVEAGGRTLNWFQRRIAADWVLDLYRLAPSGSGVERIAFYSTTRQRELLGSRRTHPLSDLLHETRIHYLQAPGAFELTQRFDEPVEVLGIWLSSDGDDSASAFELEIEQIELQTRQAP